MYWRFYSKLSAKTQSTTVWMNVVRYSCFLQFAQHVHGQRGSDHASSRQHSLGSVWSCQGTRCGWLAWYSMKFVRKILRSDIYLTSCPWDVRRNGFRSSCTVHSADRCNEPERHIFTTSCWKPARSLCSTGRNIGPQNCQRNTQAKLSRLYGGEETPKSPWATAAKRLHTLVLTVQRAECRFGRASNGHKQLLHWSTAGVLKYARLIQQCITNTAHS